MPTIREGLLLAQQCCQGGNLSQAEEIYRCILQAAPANTDALWMLGFVCQNLGKHAEAVARYREVLRLRPNQPELHNNLGNTLRDLGKLEEAEASLLEAIRLNPDYAMAHTNLGRLYAEQGKLDAAVHSLLEGMRLRPVTSEDYYDLGIAYAVQGRLDEAIAHYQRALELDPNFAKAHFGLGNAWLAKGDFEKGWPEYEWRWKSPEAKPLPLGKPRWEGESFAGRTLLLHSDQGLGDTLQFVRFAPLVRERGGRVLLACQGSLDNLLRNCPGVDDVVAKDVPLPPFDLQAPLLSVPAILRISLHEVRADVPYLKVDEARLQYWRDRLAGAECFKIGIAWQGNPKHPADRQRSFKLTQFAPLASLEGVRLFSLQRNTGSEQLEALNGQFDVIELAGRMSGDFLDSAAVVKNLNLVITADTALAHLAGALGVPVWVAVPFFPDWRWLRDREDSPWYPSIRLFRQRTVGGWEEVFDRMAATLRMQKPNC